MLDQMKKVPVALGLMFSAILGFAGAASAQTADPTGGAAGDIQEGMESWVTGQGLPMLVAMMVLGVAIALLVKFVRKGRAQV